MKKSFNNIEDFLTDESFRSWAVSPTPELEEYWLNWLSKNQDKKAIADQSKIIIQRLNFREYSPEPASKQRIFERVQQEARLRESILPNRRIWVVAALLLLVAGIVAALLYFNDTSGQQRATGPVAANGTVKHSNTPGERTRHILPDGSIADLNAGSTLEYPQSFDPGNRTVKLNGEAFFEVTHNSNRPFRVVTENLEVVVLGTQFNINTEAMSPAVALVDGKVRLRSNASAATLELSPNQMALFDKGTRSFTSTSFDPRAVTGWKDGYLVFREASFSKVLEQLRAWYGVEIAVRNVPSSPDWSYTATFRQESLENVLQSMSLLRPFEYQIRPDSLILSF